MSTTSFSALQWLTGTLHREPIPKSQFLDLGEKLRFDSQEILVAADILKVKKSFHNGEEHWCTADGNTRIDSPVPVETVIDVTPVKAGQITSSDSPPRPAGSNGQTNAWKSRAKELARFTLDLLVNRDDCHGAYRPNQAGEAKGTTVKARIHLDVLVNHYRGEKPGHAVGLHTTRIVGDNGSRTFESRWTLVDIDHHGKGPPPPENESAAIQWYVIIKSRGHDCILEDSNGRGGFHLWLIFKDSISTETAKTYTDDLVSDWEAMGLSARPEVFPKQVDPGEFGNWVRLPGRHPKHPEFWSRIFDGEDFVEGDAAINLIEKVKPIELTESDYWRIRKFQGDQHVEPAPAPKAPSFLAPHDTIEERARKYARTIDPAISTKRGHNKTFYAACKVGPGFNLSRDLTLRILIEEYNPRCQPPWDLKDLQHKVDEAFKKETARGWLIDGKQKAGTKRLSLGPGAMPRTDLGNAERLVARHGANLRYCHPWLKWMVWDGRRWKIDDTSAVRRLAKDTVRKMIQEADSLTDDAQRKALIQWSLASESRGRIDSMLALASSEDGVPILPDGMGQDPWLFNVENGTIDLRTGALKAHDRNDLLTQLCPVKYNPASQCPLWDATLKRFLVEQELIDYLQRLLGYTLSGVIREHILPVAYGTGSNAKSTILGTILDVFGPDYAMKAMPDLLMSKQGTTHPTDRMDLFRKRLVVTIETEQGRQLNETMVKELTGGDRIRGRRMREDPWEFSPTHKLILATNHKPQIQGTDKGIWRRPKLIPFAVTIEDKDADTAMPEKLKAEHEGILATCVRGCLEWQKSGLKEPDSVILATSNYRNEQDVLGAFLAEHAIENQQFRVKCGELYGRYKNWADSANEHVLTMTAFGLAMQERGFKTAKISVKWYLGIGLRDSGASNDNEDDS